MIFNAFFPFLRSLEFVYRFPPKLIVWPKNLDAVNPRHLVELGCIKHSTWDEDFLYLVVCRLTPALRLMQRTTS